jgi:hypothetical protein
MESTTAHRPFVSDSTHRWLAVHEPKLTFTYSGFAVHHARTLPSLRSSKMLQFSIDLPSQSGVREEMKVGHSSSV